MINLRENTRGFEEISEYMLVTYPPEQIARIWSFVEKGVARALDCGSAYTLEEIYDGLKDSRIQLWAWEKDSIDAVLTTSIRGEDCLLLTLSGRDVEWLPSLTIVEQWAMEHGYTRLLIYCRTRWSRLLGFKIDGRDELGLFVMSKAI